MAFKRTNLGSFSGTLYASGTITANEVGVWAEWPQYPVTAGLLRMEPADLAGDETLAVVLSVAFNAAGDGEVILHTFTTVTSTNAAENLILPGGDSGTILAVANESVGTPWPEYWKIDSTLVGTVKSMQYTIYAALVG